MRTKGVIAILAIVGLLVFVAVSVLGGSKEKAISTSTALEAPQDIAQPQVGDRYLVGSPLGRKDVPQQISYQGYLVSSSDTSAVTDTLEMTFAIYDDPDNGNMLWSETQSEVPVVGGLFSLLLGSANPFPDTLFNGHGLWLETIVEGETLLPRKKLASVPYAIKNDCWTSSGDDCYFDKSGRVGIGTLNPGEKLDVAGNIHLHNGNVIGLVPWDAFTYDGQTMGHYALGWFFDSWTLSGPTTWVSGYGGIKLFTKGTPRVAITNDGNVGIGTTNPTQKLVVDGSVYCVGNLTVDGFGITLNGPDLVIKEESRGSGGRALVHWEQNELCINFNGDFTAGTRIMGSGLKVEGRTRTSVLEITGGSDLAEPFLITDSEPLPKGALVVIDEENPGRLRLSDRSYDTRVAGIISGAGGVNPGLTLTQEGLFEGGQNVAISGRVYALATTSNGTIKPGDLLTTSSIAGYAMKATDRDRAYGAVIGKAMSFLGQGRGLVLVLVQPQ